MIGRSDFSRGWVDDWRKKTKSLIFTNKILIFAMDGWGGFNEKIGNDQMYYLRWAFTQYGLILNGEFTSEYGLPLL